jgi:hypothetical protein
VLEELGERRKPVRAALAFAWITSKLPGAPERESTLEWVEKAYAERSPLLTLLPAGEAHSDPMIDSRTG